MVPSPRLQAPQLRSAVRLRALKVGRQVVQFLVRQLPRSDFDESHGVPPSAAANWHFPNPWLEADIAVRAMFVPTIRCVRDHRDRGGQSSPTAARLSLASRISATTRAAVSLRDASRREGQSASCVQTGCRKRTCTFWEGFSSTGGQRPSGTRRFPVRGLVVAVHAATT
jgi:hypothetical protein